MYSDTQMKNLMGTVEKFLAFVRKIDSIMQYNDNNSFEGYFIADVIYGAISLKGDIRYVTPSGCSFLYNLFGIDIMEESFQSVYQSDLVPSYLDNVPDCLIYAIEFENESFTNIPTNVSLAKKVYETYFKILHDFLEVGGNVSKAEKMRYADYCMLSNMYLYHNSDILNENSQNEKSQEKKKMNYNGADTPYMKAVEDKTNQLIQNDNVEKEAHGIKYETPSLAEIANANQVVASEIINKMKDVSYQELRKMRVKMKTMNANPLGCIDYELNEFEQYFAAEDKKNRTFLNHDYGTYEFAQKAKQEYDELMREINSPDISSNSLIAFSNKLKNDTTLNVEVKREIISKIEEIIVKRDQEEFIVTNYPNLDLTSHSDENIAYLKSVCAEIHAKYGKKIISNKYKQILDAIYELENDIRSAYSRKDSVTISMGIAVIKIVGILLGLLITFSVTGLIGWKIVRWIIRLAAIGYAYEVGSNCISNISSTINYNKHVTEARRLIRK